MSKLRFTLDKVVIDPVAHIRLVRHANENASFKAFGLLYGAMYDDLAEITGVVPLPVHKPVPVEEENKEAIQAQGLPVIVEERREDEEGEISKRKYEELIAKFQFDETRLGRYVVTYRNDFWAELKNTLLMEAKEKTSFLLVLDYSLLQRGSNPYKAYRLRREFDQKQIYEWSEVSTFDSSANNPFVSIPVQVNKATLFEGLFQFNKQDIIQSLQNNYSEDAQVEDEIENFKTVIGNQINRLQIETDVFIQSKNQTGRTGIPPEQYNEFLTKSSTVHNYAQGFKELSSNVREAQNLLQNLSE